MQDIFDALVELRKAIQKQAELQEETNAVLRMLIGTLAEHSRAVYDSSPLKQLPGEDLGLGVAHILEVADQPDASEAAKDIALRIRAAINLYPDKIR